MNLTFLQALSLSATLHAAAVGGLYTLAEHGAFSVSGNGLSAIGVSFIPGEGPGGFRRDAARARLNASEIPLLPVSLERARPAAGDRERSPSISRNKTPEAQGKMIPSGAVKRGDSFGGDTQSPPGGGRPGDGGRLFGSGHAYGTGARRAILLEAPKPPYPFAARRDGFEGKVALEIHIDRGGRVSDARVLTTSGREDTDRAALETIVKQWRFDPAELDGQAVEWREKVVVSFRLR